MKKEEFPPYANEEDSLQIGDLTLENRVDRISLYGSLDLTLDKDGQEKKENSRQSFSCNGEYRSP
jgi:hypothetical protein